ncbi:MAG: hypothetical protein KBC16_03855 [Candidatus Pacebacteria bacterium]|nr:hypothetical protein [Candidatus Paceibacterota bacterium]
MLKLISSAMIAASALTLAACGDGSRSELIVQNYVVAEAPAIANGYCHLRVRPAGQEKAPTQLFSFREGSSDTIIHRAFVVCKAYRAGDLYVRSTYVRVHADKR